MDIFGIGDPLFGLGNKEEDLQVLLQMRAEEAERSINAEGNIDLERQTMRNLRWINSEIEKIVGKPKLPSMFNPWTGTRGGGGMVGDAIVAPPSPASIKKTLKAMTQLPMPMRRSSATLIEWLRKPEPLRRAVSFVKSAMNSLKAGKYSAAASSAMSAAILAGRASEEDSALASRIINTAKALGLAALKRQKKI